MSDLALYMYMYMFDTYDSIILETEFDTFADKLIKKHNLYYFTAIVKQ